MFGRRISRSGWMKLAALALAVAAYTLLLTAPLRSVSVTVDMPSPETARPMRAVDWLVFLGWVAGSIGAVFLVIVLPA